MAYIHDNVNRYLLFLILLVSTSLVGNAVFFQQKLDSMVGDHDSQISKVNLMAQELALKQTALVDAQKALELREAREERLEQLNEKLAVAPKEQPKVVADNTKPRTQVIATSIGSGFTARPRRGSAYAFIA